MKYGRQNYAIINRSVLIFLLFAINSNIFAATDLINRIDSIIAGKQMTVGVAVECGGKRIVLNDTVHFPMMSVFKLHVAMATIEKMKIDGVCLDSVVHVDKNMLLSGTYSPLKQRYPDTDFDISISELLFYSVAKSDNNACDILINLIGGIDYVDMYIRSLGINGFCISETEASMHADRQLAYANWSRPSTMLDVLKCIFASRDNPFGLLRDIMLATETGLDKIPAGVPVGIRVAHKTGSSDRQDGIKAADNDVGVILLPNVKCYIVVFIMDSAETDKTNAATIAAITREIIAEAKVMNI